MLIGLNHVAMKWTMEKDEGKNADWPLPWGHEMHHGKDKGWKMKLSMSVVLKSIIPAEGITIPMPGGGK